VPKKLDINPKIKLNVVAKDSLKLYLNIVPSKAVIFLSLTVNDIHLGRAGFEIISFEI
jgi:hypothetical protein